jgi:hypothetical protein
VVSTTVIASSSGQRSSTDQAPPARSCDLSRRIGGENAAPDDLADTGAVVLFAAVVTQSQAQIEAADGFLAGRKR